MAEYIVREALLDRIRGTGYAEPIKSNLLVMAVTIPAADVRPVVLCKDCEHSEPWYSDKSRCFLWSESGIDVFNDGFCSYGRKKAEI